MTYGWGTPMKDGYAIVFTSAKPISGKADTMDMVKGQIIDKNGNVTYELPSEYVGAEGGNDGFFFVNKALGQCGDGLFAVVSTRWGAESKVIGYMDAYGNMKINLEGRGYTDVSSFCNGVAAVRNQSNAWGFIDTTGKTVIPCEYDDAFGGFGGLDAVAKNGKYGLIDLSNNVVVPFEYDDITEYEEGVAYAVKNGKLYIITGSDTSVTPEASTPTPAVPETPAAPVTPAVPETPATPAASVILPDVPSNAWYAEAANFIVSRGYIELLDNGKFIPKICIPYNEATKMLNRVKGEDVLNVRDWEGQFEVVNTPTSREKFVTMLWKVAGEPSVETNTSFADGGKMIGRISDFAKPAVNWAVSKGIISGYSDGTFYPLKDVSRAEAAKMIMAYCQLSEG